MFHGIVFHDRLFTLACSLSPNIFNGNHFMPGTARRKEIWEALHPSEEGKLAQLDPVSKGGRGNVWEKLHPEIQVGQLVPPVFPMAARLPLSCRCRREETGQAMFWWR